MRKEETGKRRLGRKATPTDETIAELEQICEERRRAYNAAARAYNAFAWARVTERPQPTLAAEKARLKERMERTKEEFDAARDRHRIAKGKGRWRVTSLLALLRRPR